MTTEVPSRDLRNDYRSLLRRVEEGEEIVITVEGRPVAVLAPVARRTRWMHRREFIRRVLTAPADPALRADLARLAPDTTDDLAPLA